ncbi:hypothetical protein [Halalkalicoccus tibetensis]|uniref:Uncharacterized protein n=1 Tax=Halalkalicoccus tibetensis TaxID=175632 RepID=A0ABD5V2L2_9EURY
MAQDRLGKAAAIFLFVSLSLATIIAHQSPATGYELTIYTGTPVGYWVFFGAVLLVGTILAVWDIQRRLALSALGIAITTFVLLPVIRGYYMLGQRDSLTHLGRVRDTLAGSPISEGFLYPNYPIFSAVFVRVTGLPENQVLLLATAALILPSLAFIPLLVREIDPSRMTVVASAVIAVGLLPLNPFNVFLWPHPSAQIVFFAAIPLYAFLRIFRGQGRLTYSVLFGVSLLSVLYFHPQQALNVFFVTGAMTVGIFAAKRHSVLPELYRAPVSVFAAVGAFVWLRVTSIPRFEDVFASTIVTILIAGSSDGHRESGSIFESLEALGVSFELFALSIVGKYLPLVVPAAVAIYIGFRTRRRPELALLAVGGLFVVPFVAYFMVAGNVNQWGRYVAFLALLFCVFAAVGLGAMYRHLAARKGIPVANIAIAVLLCLSLAASVPVMQPSPLTQQGNTQVSNGMYSGYESMINHTDRATPIYDTRSPPDRYVQAIDEVSQDRVRYETPDRFNNHNLPGFVERDSYLAINEGDIRQDVELYDGFRYSEADFEYLSQDPDIHKVQDGDVELYQVDSRDDSTPTDEP